MAFSPQFPFKNINYTHIYLTVFGETKACGLYVVSNSQYVVMK